MTKEKLAPAGSTLNAYQLFHQAADRGNYRKAFTILKAQPHLVDHMTLSEIWVLSRMMTGSLGKREARHFIESIECRMRETVRVLKFARRYYKELRKERQHEIDHGFHLQKLRDPSQKARRRWGMERRETHY
jgi:hypothetical protein